MRFAKMHALGNNYIYVSQFEERLTEEELPSLAVAVSDVRRGIGSDGLILIGPSTVADVRMRIFNADGSEAENCGNGLRCVAKYVFEHGYVQSPTFTIEVEAGIVTASVHATEGARVDRVTIDMGRVSFDPVDVGYIGSAFEGDEVAVGVGDEVFLGSLVSVGNPHYVSFVPDASAVAVEHIGPHIERHPDFPKRINVEFVSVRGRNEIDFRVWERGSGITHACGTGACASVAAGIRRGLLDEKVIVHLLGGDLEIELKDGHVWMTGEAVEVLTGDFHWATQLA
jgi:diaminopimelate epimerase